MPSEPVVEKSHQAQDIGKVRDGAKAMRLLVGEALVNAAHARPDDHYVLSVARLNHLGLDCGDKYASARFVRVAEFCAGKLLEFGQAEVLNAELGGLGVVSPLSCSFDAVSVGDTMFARNETFQIITVTALDPCTGKLSTHFLNCPSIGSGHDGDAQAQVVLNALAHHPAKLTSQSLRQRVLTMVGGDGAVAKGGPEMRHVSTDACQKFSKLVYTNDVETLCEWEMFHRSETAFRRTLQDCPMSQELFAVARGMAQQFGCGVGRIILRSVGSLADESNNTPAADIGGTRKGEAMTRIAENVLRNYRKYALGLHAKLARKRQGHGSSTIQSLLALGRRLLSVDFLLFTVAFKDLMCRQRIFTLFVQGEGHFPWENHALFIKKQQECADDLELLRNLRRLVSITTLLQHYCDKASIKHFLFAHLYTSFGRRFPSTCGCLYEVLIDRHFHKVPLQSFADLHPNTMCATPRCRCRALCKTAPQSSGAILEVQLKRGKGRKKKNVVVPIWVAHSTITKQQVLEESNLALIDVPLRYETFEKFPTPSHLQGRSLFRTHHIQCQTSRLVPLVHQQAQLGLASAEHFLKQLQRNYAAYWGNVGLCQPVRQFYDDIVRVWDFPFLLQLKPREDQKDALLRLMDLYRPKMELFKWPDFDYVAHVWPAGKEAWRQFLVLGRILRNNPNKERWYKTVGYMVSLLPKPNHVLSLFLGRSFRHLPPRARLELKQNILSYVWCPQWFEAKPTSLAKFQSRGHHLQASSELTKGTIAIFTKSHFKGKCVQIQAVAQELCVASVIQSIVTDPTLHHFSLNGKSTHCWHICMLLALCGTSASASSACERVGSFLHCVETGDSAIYAARIANRLRLKVSQFEGIAARDDWIIEEVASTLMDAGKDPFVKKRQQRKRKAANLPPVGNPTLGARQAASSSKQTPFSHEIGAASSERLSHSEV